MKQAVRVAAGGAIVILGVTPDRPETGFGYIRAGDAFQVVPSHRFSAPFDQPPFAQARQCLAGETGGIIRVRLRRGN